MKNKDSKTIYTVTTLTNLPDENDFRKKYHSRCVGWFATLEDARHCVDVNMGDIFEYYYPYAIIEAVHEGLYQTDVDYELFKFNTQHHGYLPMEVPECMRHLAAFGIG